MRLQAKPDSLKEAIRLGEITQENWLEATRLELGEGQSAFVAGPVGILARGYVYRDCRAQVWTVEEDGRIVGLAMVREFDEEPLGYELQQLLIDRREQGRGVGSAALGPVLGRYHADSQRRALEEASAELRALREGAAEDRRRLGRVYTVLGVAGGLLLVILLI